VAIFGTNVTEPRKNPISQLPDKISKYPLVTFLVLILRVYVQNFSAIGLKLREEFELSDRKKNQKDE